MANKRLTDLTELTDAADNDFLYIVDVSDTTESAQGTSKKIRKDKVDSGASKENITNKQNSLAIDGTGTKYPTVDAVNNALPTSYSKIVYVNATSPTTATIFDLENPPVTNDNLLKNDTANLYIGTDASTWVYLTGTGYVTKTISSATSNFNTFGTTVDAGNSKTSHITRSGPVTLTGSLNLAVAKISTTPNTSAGSYDILTRNSSTTAIEKKLVSDFVQTTTSQYITGRKVFASDNTVAGGIGILNSKTTSSGFSDNFGVAVFNTGNTGIYAENTTSETTGTAIVVVNSSNTGVGLSIRNFASGVGLTLKNLGGTGDLLSAELGKVTISSAGKLSTTEVATSGNNVPNKTYVDGKITQTITNGVTDKSPSEDAVFDALANVTRNIISNSGLNTPLTGTLSNTILKSVLIPSNTFSDYSILNMPSLKFEKTGTNATATFRIYINTVNSLSGATQIGTYTSANNATLIKMVRSYPLRANTLSGIIFTASNTSDIGVSVSPISSTTYDVTTDIYLIISGQLGNINDSVLLSELIIQK